MTSFCPFRVEILTEIFREFPITDPVVAIALLLDAKIRATNPVMHRAYFSELPLWRMRHVRARLIATHGDDAETAFVYRGYLVQMSPEECLATVARACSAQWGGDRFLELLHLWNRTWQSVDRGTSGRQKVMQLSEIVRRNEMVEVIDFDYSPDEYQFPLGPIELRREQQLKHLPLRGILGLCYEESVAETERTSPNLLCDLQVELTALKQVIQSDMSSIEIVETLAVIPDVSEGLPDQHVLLQYDYPAGGDAGAMHMLLASGYSFRDYLATYSSQSLDDLVMCVARNWHAAPDDTRMLEIAKMHLGFFPDIGRPLRLKSSNLR